MYYTDKKNIESVAVMADNNLYRYRLTRTWDKEKEIVAVMMLNPSKANSLKTDNTIMNLTNYLIDNDFGGIDIVNMYAYMATKTAELKNKSQSYEIHNNNHIIEAANQRDTFIIAWGSDQKEHVKRKREVEALLLPFASKLKCFEDTQGKSPRHPLLLATDWNLRSYQFRYI
ncbi:DUF1643 domain-containing protein [Paenibacillus sp. Marseille-Q4541]|uniref:DUF1643 domain-containing protein n=1 Tax=Paenibacillus sp. Marseille-Q4541 TaxID=2831522 RepID=UPI001BA999B4|nr:DUF1643 domain-containing protein [Paenibacillus sp. Marseille-Q4541]